MARAYIVLARNDLDDNILQVLDLHPNTSQRNSIYSGAGQTHVLTHFLNDGVNTAVTVDNPGAGGANARDFAAGTTHYGLSTYILDTVEDTAGGNDALTAAEAVAIADAIEGRVVAGLPLTLAAINTLIVAATAAGNDLDGTLGNSIGTVEDILRILAGERYRVAGGAVVQLHGTTNFVSTARGTFVTRPNVERPESVRAANGAGIRGRNPFRGHVLAPSVPVQTGTQDVNFREVLQVVDTGALQSSALNGALSRMASDDFTFLNPLFTYGAGGTALGLSGTVIPSTGMHRAVTVYASDGSVIA